MSRSSITEGLRAELEPAVRDHISDQSWGLAEADRLVAVSTAISLRRIADALERIQRNLAS